MYLDQHFPNWGKFPPWGEIYEFQGGSSSWGKIGEKNLIYYLFVINFVLLDKFCVLAAK